MIASFLQHKIDDAKRVIEAGLRIVPNTYVSCSFGKDSTVCLWLAIQIRPDIPVVWFDGGKYDEYPDTYAFIDELKLKWKLNLTTIRPAMSFADQMRTYGVDDEIHYRQFFVRAFREEQKRSGFTGSILGLRSEESNNRRITFRVRGQLYYHKGDAIWRICPVMNWTATDIWNIIDACNIPVHPIYLKNIFQRREKIRLGCMANALKHERGDIVYIKYYYPDLWNDLVAEFPEFSTMT